MHIGAPDLARYLLGHERAIRRSWDACAIFSAQRQPERIDSIKDLVLEVPRLPLTHRSALSPISSPVARAASLRLTTFDADPDCRTLSLVPRSQTTTMPLADNHNYSKPIPRPQPLSAYSISFSCTSTISGSIQSSHIARNPHKHWQFHTSRS